MENMLKYYFMKYRHHLLYYRVAPIYILYTTKKENKTYKFDHCTIAGADQGFQVRGGALKKIAPSRGRHENFWGISCEKSRFYAKKSYFSNFREGARNFWGISCEKSRFYAKKKSYFYQF